MQQFGTQSSKAASTGGQSVYRNVLELVRLSWPALENKLPFVGITRKLVQPRAPHFLHQWSKHTIWAFYTGHFTIITDRSTPLKSAYMLKPSTFNEPVKFIFKQTITSSLILSGISSSETTISVSQLNFFFNLDYTARRSKLQRKDQLSRLIKFWPACILPPVKF